MRPSPGLSRRSNAAEVGRDRGVVARGRRLSDPGWQNPDCVLRDPGLLERSPCPLRGDGITWRYDGLRSTIVRGVEHPVRDSASRRPSSHGQSFQVHEHADRRASERGTLAARLPPLWATHQNRNASWRGVATGCFRRLSKASGDKIQVRQKAYGNGEPCPESSTCAYIRI